MYQISNSERLEYRIVGAFVGMGAAEGFDVHMICERTNALPDHVASIIDEYVQRGMLRQLDSRNYVVADKGEDVLMQDLRRRYARFEVVELREPEPYDLMRIAYAADVDGENRFTLLSFMAMRQIIESLRGESEEDMEVLRGMIRTMLFNSSRDVDTFVRRMRITLDDLMYKMRSIEEEFGANDQENRELA